MPDVRVVHPSRWPPRCVATSSSGSRGRRRAQQRVFGVASLGTVLGGPPGCVGFASGKKNDLRTGFKGQLSGGKLLYWTTQADTGL